MIYKILEFWAIFKSGKTITDMTKLFSLIESWDFDLLLLGSNIAVRHIYKNVIGMQNCAQNNFDSLPGNNVAFGHILKSQYLLTKCCRAILDSKN